MTHDELTTPVSKESEALADAVSTWAFAMWQADKAEGFHGMDERSLRHEIRFQRYTRRYRRRMKTTNNADAVWAMAALNAHEDAG